MLSIGASWPERHVYGQLFFYLSTFALLLFLNLLVMFGFDYEHVDNTKQGTSLGFGTESMSYTLCNYLHGTSGPPHS